MPKTAVIDTPWLKPTDVAAILNLDVRTIYLMLKDGRLPSHNLGGRVIRIHRDDLDKALGRTPAPAPFDGLTDEQIQKIAAAVDIWPTLTPEKREMLSALLALAPDLAAHRDTA